MSNSRKRKRLQAIAIPVTVNAKGVRSRLGNGLKPKSVTALLTHGTSTAMHKALTCPRYTDAERLSVGMNETISAVPSKSNERIDDVDPVPCTTCDNQHCEC